MSTAQDPFTQPLAVNPAIVLLGHPVTDERITVASDIESLGLKLMRASPCDINLVGIPDLVQMGYGEYIRNLSAFMYSYVMNIRTTNGSPTYFLTYTDMIDKNLPLVPFNPPGVFLTFESNLPVDTAASIRAYYNATSVQIMGKQGFVWNPEDWDVIPYLQEYRPVKTSMVPRDFVNPSALLAARQILAWLSAILHLHKYPAFTDPHHMRTLQKFDYSEIEQADGDAMDVDNAASTADLYLEAQTTVFGDGPVITKSSTRLVIDMKYDRDTRKGIPFIIKNSEFENELPQAQGLIVPYFSALSKDDKTTVPDFIERYIAKTTGDSLEDVVRNLRTIRAEWGVIASTPFGNQVSHLVRIMDVGLQAQARIIPIFEGSHYLGCVLSGGGYSIDCARRVYRPVDRSSVVTARAKADVHRLSLDTIASKVSEQATKVSILKSKTMWELHCTLVQAQLKEVDRRELIEAARGLCFEGHKSWQVNLANLEQGFNLIRLPMPLTIENNLPIHYTCLLETGKIELVWSSFGGMAPSFKVPGGKKFSLKEDMTFDLPGKNPRSEKQQQARLVRVAVHDKPLDQAIKDLKNVMEQRSIDNPLVMPRVKRSESSHNKAFMGDDGSKLLRLLREFTGLDTDIGNRPKRVREDDEPGTSVGKRRRAEDY